MLAISLYLGLASSVADPKPHLVAKVPEGLPVVEGTLHFSRDGAACVYALIQNEKEVPVVGGVPGVAFTTVISAEIDPSGEHTAFRVSGIDPKRKVEQYSIVYDGKVVASESWIGPVALDPLNGVPAYWIAHGHAQAATLVWGKYKSAKWQAADEASPPLFSPEGKFLATVCTRGQGEFNVLLVDGKGKEDKHIKGEIWEVTPSPREDEVAYTGVELVGENRWKDTPQQFWIKTECIDRAYEPIFRYRVGEDYASAGSPVYSPDGHHLAYKVLKSSKMGVAIDEQKDAACEYTFVDELAPKPDGSAVAFVARDGCTLDAENGREVLRRTKATGGKWFVVQGKTRSAEYEAAHIPTWSPDGKLLAYAAKAAGKWYVCIDAKRSEPCDEIACITWSEDGRHVWYGCRKGSELWWQRMEVG